MTTPDQIPRATGHIDQMVALIQKLIEGDHAYRTVDGSIFFRISSWPAYGKLAKVDPSSVTLSVLVKDAKGDWQERERKIITDVDRN